MIGNIPFAIPNEFATGLANGSLVRIGTLLKESGTGKIVAHVQESGIAQRLLSNVISSPFASLDVLNIASSGYANIQLGHLTTMVEGLATLQKSLQVLQYANLGISIAGIGVSVIGFAMMTKRLKSIEGNISDLSNKLDHHFQDLFNRDLRAHYSQVYALLDKADIAQSLTNSSAELLSVSSHLGDESGFFHGEIAHLLEKDKFDEGLFVSFVRSLVLCDAGRIECLMQANELPAAHKTASVIGRNYRALFDDISPFQIANKVLPIKLDNHDYSKFRQRQTEMKTLVHGVRDITDAALTKPALIETLIENNIEGRVYIDAIRREKEHPIILFKPF